VRTVLFVGAGRYQLAAIRRAKELGHRVVAVDRNPDAPGFPEVDVARVVDFADTDATLAAIADLAIDGVLTVQSDRAVPIVAALAEALSLPGIGAQTARLMTDKVAMRGGLAAGGVPQPRFTTLRSAAEAERAAAEVGLPAVLKPVDSSGQKGVFRIESVDEIRARWEETKAVSPAADVLLEQFVAGVEMNGIVVASGGEPLVVVLCDRLRPPGESFGISWIHLYPASVAGEQLDESERVAAEAARALGLESGIAFPQLIAGPDGSVVVVECAARIGGLMAEHVRHALGIDLLELQIRLALGEEIPPALVRERFRRPTAIRFLTAEPGPLRTGRVRRVGPLDRVLAAPGVVEAELYVQEGEEIQPVMRVSDRRGWVIAVADTREEALARAEAASLLVDIELERA
jgi:biotin carboxylase